MHFRLKKVTANMILNHFVKIKKTTITENKHPEKVYIINPYLLRKVKEFSVFLSQKFGNILTDVKDSDKPLHL